ncbi:MAG TPA: T9SS type A sorting domain-containing protein, partial [Candidatus Cloacimonadota bacterium]|nr:T9SS type A sorting domain-containing protein [Candidatus Cloacimonadota bacterium]
TSSSGNVIVTSGNLTFGDMTLNQTTASSQAVQFMITDTCPSGVELAFKLHIQGIYDSNNVSYDLNFSTNENGPDFIINSIQLGTDNVLTPGETSQLTVVLKNQGAVNATNVAAHLSSPNPNVTINTANANYGTIAANGTGTNSTAFSLTANSSLYVGTPIKLFVEVSYNGGSSQIVQKDITIGSPLSASMTGPDDYGYICVANSDSHPLAQTYNWIEINPSLGGTGTSLSLSDNDTNGSGSWATVTMPFSLRYYGVMYNQITICSNGFIMPGSEGSQEWMNWVIPGPMVPKPIIAPFWDDLIIQSTSKVCYKYDSTNHKFIVEWSQLRNRYDQTQIETFEVVFYDALNYATATGDNAFLFQYNSFHNVDAGNYGVDNVDHGQYCTVGIADHTGLVGIQYTYQALYPQTATTLTNNATLYFTTIPSYSAAPNPVVLSCPITEITAVYPNNQIDAGETVSLSPVITNSGYGTLKNSTIILSCSDPYITLINANTTLNAILSSQNASVITPLIIAVSDECPNMRQVTLHLQYTTTDGLFNSDFSIIVHAPQISYASCLFDAVSNPILIPNSTVPVVLQIQNMSNLPIQNGTFTFQSNPYWTAIPNQFACDIPASGSVDLNFNLTVSASAPLGEEITLGGAFTIPAVYDSTFTLNLMVGNWSDLVMETFDNAELQGSWYFSDGTNIAAASHIHTTGSEIVISPTGMNQGYQVETPLINGFDSQLVQVGFTYCNFNPNVANAIYVSYDQGTTWNSLFTFNTVHTTPVSIQFNIADLPENVSTMQFKWVTNTLSNDTGQVILDDIHIQSVHHALGNVSGSVSMESLPANVTQVKISSPYLPDQSAYPDQSGHFNLSLFQGVYPYLKAELPGYLTTYLNNIGVTSEQTTTINSFVMPYLQKPINLQYSTNQEILNLAWQLENPPVKSGERMAPDFYRIYIVQNNIVTEDTTTALNYQYTLVEGNYTIYVKGVFHDSMGQEAVSSSSNVLQFAYTANEDNIQVPNIFALERNYPNPFNPSTTIRYAIKDQGRVTLRVYNVKGQLVNTLVNDIKSPGKYSLIFDGTDTFGKSLASGVYFYRLSSGNQTVTNKMILVK